MRGQAVPLVLSLGVEYLAAALPGALLHAPVHGSGVAVQVVAPVRAVAALAARQDGRRLGRTAARLAAATSAGCGLEVRRGQGENGPVRLQLDRGALHVLALDVQVPAFRQNLK